MRVVQLGPLPPPHGGVQANLSAIHERLVMLGGESLLVGITRSYPDLDEPNVFRPGSGSALIKLLLILKPDVIHLHFGGDFTRRLAALAAVCGFVPRAKTVLTFHSGGFASSAAGKAANFFSQRGFAVRRLDKIIAVNAEIAALFQKYGVAENKIALVAPHVLRQPNPQVQIPPHLLRFIENHSPLLFTASLLENHYDLPIQIKALQAVREKYPNAGLLIAGSGIQEKELKQMIAATDYAEHVLLAGDVKHEIVLHLMKRADILLRTTFYDGDAISVREALHLGTPVVASDNRMRPAGVKLFPVGDLPSLETAVLEQLKSGKLETTKSGDGWANIDAVIQIYAELFGSKSVRPKFQTSPIQNPKSEIQNS